MTDGRAVMASTREDTLRHEAWFYRTTDEFLDGTTRFIRTGLGAGDPVFVAVPGPKIEPLRADLGKLAPRVGFVDMIQVGRNPSRIIPTVRRFTEAHPDRRVHFVGEPIWSGRSAAEICEGTRHEALLNTAFADTCITIFCPYDSGRLDRSTIGDAERTHPVLVYGNERQPSRSYADPALIYARVGHPLSEPPPGAEALSYGHGDLSQLRRLVRQRAMDAGVERNRLYDVVLAVNEVATNTLSHVREGGTLTIWQDTNERELICELRDHGRIRDPLVGRRQPSPNELSGRGLWMVNELCDLVELRSGADGTATRLHIGIG